MNVLSVIGLTRRFGPLLVLDHVSFSVPFGSIAVLVGPNGAGKTTLLLLVRGLDLVGLVMVGQAVFGRWGS